MPLLSHLQELRRRMLIVAVAVLIGSLLGYFLNSWIFDLLVEPYATATGQESLNVFEVGEAFSITMKLSLFAGIVLASPVWVYQLWAFVGPALSRRERRWVIPLSVLLAGLFGGGVWFAYWTLPRALSWLLGFGDDRLTPVLGVSKYFDFSLRYLGAFGFTFEFPVFLFAAGLAGIVTSRQLRRGRRWAMLIVVVAGAAVTPGGDPLTLLLLTVPLYLMYEITILAVRFIAKR